MDSGRCRLPTDDAAIEPIRHGERFIPLALRRSERDRIAVQIRQPDVALDGRYPRAGGARRRRAIRPSSRQTTGVVNSARKQRGAPHTRTTGYERRGYSCAFRGGAGCCPFFPIPTETRLFALDAVKD